MTTRNEETATREDSAQGVQAPRHGYQGDRGAEPQRPAFPLGVTVCISRESGARGTTIGRRVGRKLGFQVYDQELLEFMAHDGSAGANTSDTPADVADWVDQQVQALLRDQILGQQESIIRLTRILLTLAAQGSAVLIGRGAGFLLPASHTLHVRIVAPLPERIAYIGQSLRLSQPEATEYVRTRDLRRQEFLATHFRRPVDELHSYDLLLSSSRLGEDEAVELICHAVRTRQQRVR